MRRFEVEIEIQPGGKVTVNVREGDGHSCKTFKEFFTRVLTSTTEEEFQQIRLPAKIMTEADDHTHTHHHHH